MGSVFVDSVLACFYLWLWLFYVGILFDFSVSIGYIGCFYSFLNFWFLVVTVACCILSCVVVFPHEVLTSCSERWKWKVRVPAIKQSCVCTCTWGVYELYMLLTTTVTTIIIIIIIISCTYTASFSDQKVKLYVTWCKHFIRKYKQATQDKIQEMTRVARKGNLQLMWIF